jgi:hypothetical protein
MRTDEQVVANIHDLAGPPLGQELMRALRQD